MKNRRTATGASVTPTLHTTTFDRGLLAFPRDAPPPHVVEIPVRVR